MTVEGRGSDGFEICFMSRLTMFLVFTVLLFILAVRFFLFYHNQPRYVNGQYVSFETTLLSEPQISGKYQNLSANLASGEKIFIKTSISPQFHYGDSVRISGVLNKRVLNNKKTAMTMFFPKIEAVKGDKNLPYFFVKNILALASLIRQKIIFLFEKALSPTSASLLLGIVFGIKESTPKDFADNLRISGVLHVVAASGMNVTIIGGFLSSIFSLFLRRQIAIAASILGILFYATLAGLEPSIIRASIMGILVFSAAILGRQNLAFYGLILAGFLMLFISPSLIFDVGFQLSFAATLGLLYIKPIIERKESIKTVLEKSIIGEEVSTTISAQAATIPILLANFGMYSIWSVVVNGLVLWVVPILMIIGGLGAILGLVVLPLGTFVLYLSLPLLLYFEKTVNLFAGLGGVFKTDSLPWQITVGYYGILISFILIFRRGFFERKEAN